MPKARRGRQPKAIVAPESPKPMSGGAGFREEATPFVAALLDSNGAIAVDRVADAFCLTKFQLADILGLARETLYKPARSHAPKTQARLRDMLEIISFIEGRAGGKLQAMAWYRAYAIPEFGRTAEALVKSGHASWVREHFDRLALGGFA